MKILKQLLQFYKNNRFLILIITTATLLIQLFVPRTFESSKSLKAYMNMVEHLSRGNIKNKELTIKFDSLDDSSEAAKCYYITGEIVVDREHWEVLSENLKILLVAHEMGHCYCWIGHIGKSKLCPDHFMSPSLPTETCADLNMNRYIVQMRKLDC